MEGFLIATTCRFFIINWDETLYFNKLHFSKNYLKIA